MKFLVCLNIVLILTVVVIGQQTRPRDPSTTFAALDTGGSTANGVHVYCTDCSKNTDPCTGGGSGAMADRVNGVWVCGASVTGSTPPFADTTSVVKGSADGSKELRFEVDGLTASTTRVWTVPNFDQNFFGFTSTSSNLTLDNSHYFVNVDASGGNKTETLPACSSALKGKIYVIKKTDTSSNTVTIAPDGSETIDNGPNLIFEYNGKARAVVCDGAGAWWVQ